MANTLIGVFKNLEDAVEAREKLREKGFADSAIKLHQDSAVMSSAGPDSRRQSAGEWLKSLFSLDEDYVGMYSEAVRRGHHLLAVDANTQREVDIAVDAMEQSRCIDIEDTAQQWRGEGWQGPQRPAAGAGRIVAVRTVRIVARP
ncbi:MAG TPA: hypothetical protein VM491_07835 [Burkholderiaceae bacterium]|jgi:hypothetical protein|nr:hypothetical protein [Burkholderiaceae bacterium]